MVAVYIVGGVVLVLLVLLIAGYIKLCWYSIPYDEWVEFQRMERKKSIARKRRKRGRIERWKRLRKK